jgi:hypothetical protein
MIKLLEYMVNLIGSLLLELKRTSIFSLSHFGPGIDLFNYVRPP